MTMMMKPRQQELTLGVDNVARGHAVPVVGEPKHQRRVAEPEAAEDPEHRSDGVLAETRRHMAEIT
jgi:hypothetical protein